MSNYLNEQYLAYYEQESFRGKTYDDYSPHEKERVDTIVSIIPKDVNSILDVGCGDGVIVNVIAGKYEKIVGLDLSTEALKYVKTEHVHGSSDNIPFPDDSFDLVITCDTLEHLPLNSYKPTLEELFRVSKKYVLVNTPYNENLVTNHTRCDHCGCIFHICRHLRSLNDETYDNIGSEHNHKIIEKRYIEVPIKYFPAFLWKLLHICGYWPYFDKALCPSCGNNSIQKSKKNLFSFILLKISRLFLKITVKVKAQIIVLYEKCN